MNVAPLENAKTDGQLRSAYLVVAFGFCAILFEGYDLITYGSAVPALLAYSDWSLTPARVGAIGSAALFGMFLGAPFSGWLADRFGRRKLFIGILSFFSAMMILVALAPSPALLGLFRFLAGLGFGGIPPTAIALVVEFAPPRRKVLFTTVMLAGFGVGGILAGMLSIALLGPIGFRGLFAVGALPLVTVVPLALWLLPESPSYRRKATAQQGDRVTPGPWGRVLRGRAGIATALFAAASFFELMMSFGLSTWLPQLMRGAGHDLGSALRFLMVLQVGALIGALCGGWLGDHFGGRAVATSMLAIAATALALMAVPMSAGMTMLAVFIAGAAGLGSQTVLFGYIATHWAHESRATALGLTAGIGRLGAAAGPLVGGLLVGAGVGLGGSVTVFAAAAVIAGLAAVSVPRIPAAPVSGHAPLSNAPTATPAAYPTKY